MLGGVAEVVSSNPSWAIKYFSAFSGIVDLLYIYIYIYIYIYLYIYLSLSLYIYIYIYIYMCVCVCVYWFATYVF